MTNTMVRWWILFIVAVASVGAPEVSADAPAGGDGRCAGICYGPFRDNEDPDAGIFPDGDAVQHDLEFLAKLTRGIRTYGTAEVLREMAWRSERAGLDCYPGAWISSHRANNAKEIQGLVTMCTFGVQRVRAAIVGNEVLLRNEQTEDQMIEYVRDVKRRVPVPVTYAGTWKEMLAHPRLVAELDFLLVHIHPYWDGVAVEDAPAHVMRTCRQLQERFPGKRVVIGETGWPSAGAVVGKAVPGDENQGRFLREFVKLAAEGGVDYFLFEAFDEHWKAKSTEGDVGAHWGIFRSDGSVKPHNTDLMPPGVSAGQEGVRLPRVITAQVVTGSMAVYTDWDAQENAFSPSGWMGDIEDVALDDACPSAPHSGSTCLRVVYTPAGKRGWAGIYWQHPGNNWGRYPGYVLRGAARLEFWARGETGGEMVEFKTGGINRDLGHDPRLPHADSFGPITTGIVKLTAEWKRYEIPLAEQDLSSLIGGFCWVAKRFLNPRGCTLYLDDIRFVEGD